MALTEITAGLAEALQAIPGLRVVAMPSDTVNPPEAVVDFPTTVLFDSMLGHVDAYTIRIRVYVGRSDERSARLALARFLGSGDSSVKRAVEANPTLNGAAKNVAVLRAENVGYFDVAAVSYLGCDFICEVLA